MFLLVLFLQAKCSETHKCTALFSFPLFHTHSFPFLVMIRNFYCNNTRCCSSGEKIYYDFGYISKRCMCSCAAIQLVCNARFASLKSLLRRFIAIVCVCWKKKKKTNEQNKFWIQCIHSIVHVQFIAWLSFVHMCASTFLLHSIPLSFNTFENTPVSPAAAVVVASFFHFFCFVFFSLCVAILVHCIFVPFSFPQVFICYQRFKPVITISNPICMGSFSNIHIYASAAANNKCHQCA